MAGEKISLSVVLPAYNEEKNIGSTVKQVFSFLPEISYDFEVIVIDDGSRDNTAAVISSLKDTYGQLDLVVHPSNRGYGNALISGFRKASKEYVFFMDSDGQFDFREIKRLLIFKEDYDIVAGIRIERKDGVVRDLNGTFFNFAVKFMFGIPIMDIDCGFKLFKASVLKEIKLSSPGALINTEILVRARRNNRSLMVVGITHYPRGRGRQTGASLKVVLRALYEMIKLKYDLIKGR